MKFIFIYMKTVIAFVKKIRAQSYTYNIYSYIRMVSQSRQMEHCVNVLI